MKNFVLPSLCHHPLKTCFVGLGFSLIGGLLPLSAQDKSGEEATARSALPNIILCMTDDQGWGDTGFNGHPILKTPHLDEMAAEGIRFTRFYAGAPVCTPTRASVVTGRHATRYGMNNANRGHMKPQEVTLAEALREHGYATGHFGKWHMGTLSKTDEGVHPARRNSQEEDFSPPWENGFDTCFSVEAALATWDSMVNPRFGMHYYTGPGEKVTDTDWMRGDSSRVMMDKALPFIRDAVDADKPFFAIIWFHTPHEPIASGGEYLEMYEDITQEDHPGTDLKTQKHYYGCLTAMDEQMGRLRQELRELGVAENTLLFFTSDNGPEGNLREEKKDRLFGSTAGLRGRKRSLFEGGIRVPSLMVWPAKFPEPKVIETPAFTSDYLPTVLSAAGVPLPSRPVPRDGIDFLPFVRGDVVERDQPMAFEYRNSVALIDGPYKLIKPHSFGNPKFQHPSGYVFYDLPATQQGRDALEPYEGGYELYNVVDDPQELHNIAEDHPDIVEHMKAILEQWQQSCEQSANGEDYLTQGTTVEARKGSGVVPFQAQFKVQGIKLPSLKLEPGDTLEFTENLALPSLRSGRAALGKIR
ncbi:MAG: sulfatase [Verrucomicrobiota bacterium]